MISLVNFKVLTFDAVKHPTHVAEEAATIMRSTYLCRVTQLGLLRLLTTFDRGFRRFVGLDLELLG